LQVKSSIDKPLLCRPKTPFASVRKQSELAEALMIGPYPPFSVVFYWTSLHAALTEGQISTLKLHNTFSTKLQTILQSPRCI